MVLVGGTSTLTQILAVASLGLPVTFEWSTGGLVAGIASIWMWIQCRSWAAWRRWVWIPVIITVVVAFVTINLMLASAQQETERQAAEQHATMCTAAEAELASTIATHENFLEQTWAYDGGWRERPSEWRPQPSDGTGPTWRDRAEELGLEIGPSPDEVWAYYSALGGPQLETEVSQQQATYALECGSD